MSKSAAPIPAAPIPESPIPESPIPESPIPDRQARMLRILRQLQLGSGLNATDLAGQLDVCRRTIFRDLNTMRRAGIDLHFDARFDCYRLTPQKNTVVMPKLEQDELTTLIAAVHLSVLRHMPDCSDLLRQSINKLLASSPRNVQNHATRVINSCCVNTADVKEGVKETRIVHHILSAISQRKILRVKVVDAEADEEIETRFAPYQVIAATDNWQVVGRSSHHRGVRTFDPRLMKHLEITDEIYAIPRRFHLAS